MKDSKLNDPHGIETLMRENYYIETNADSGSMKKYIRNFFREFPKELLDDDKLKKTLVEILHSAFFTTFVDDYDLNDAGIGLEKLREFPREIVDVCLNHLNAHSTTFFVPEYVKEFRKKYNY